MLSAVKKDILREIKGSKNRFLAIMVLSMLAVAFLSGLKVTAPDMKTTGDLYLDDMGLMDVQVISTLGITDEDVAALYGSNSVDYAVGAYVLDAWAGDAVAKVYSITDQVNRLTVMEGRLPVVSRECVLDEGLLSRLGLAIGDTLTVTLSEDDEDSLVFSSFRIVGTVRSPYYISVERGSASIGSGSVQGYVYLKENAFNTDCYTIAYLKIKGAMELTAFTEEYDDYIEAVIDELEPLGEKRALLRHDEVITEATDKIEEAEQELADAEQEVADRMAEAEQELADARKKLDNGWYEYRKGKKELEDAYPDLVKSEAELWDGYYELEDGQKEYDDGLKEYQANLGEYEKNLAEYQKSRAEVTANISEINAYYEGKAALEQGIAGCDSELARLNGLTEGDEGYDTKDEAIAAAQANKAELEGRLSALTSGVNEAELAANKARLEGAIVQLEQGKPLLDEGKAKLDEAKAKLDQAKQQLNKGWAEYYQGKKELEDGWDEYLEGMEELPKARRRLNKSEAEYEDGLKELEEAKAEAQEEIDDAKEKLADARRKVAEIEEGEWYILSRDYNPGYTGFGQDAERMANLATVFPVIFFLVAGLVCLTTMTRMVEEHRTEIGLMKAIGYGRLAISAKYLCYGLLPSLAGSLIGLVIGHTLFPVMIYVSYQIMYEMPDITLRVYPGLSIMSTLAAVACATLSTLWACLSTLEDSPANLMRPRAPKPGKRVLLERIPALWSPMSFNWKITIRNLFRYKKRFWMTVIGISGCTALVIAGVGLRDSLTMTMNTQYDELFSYDAQLTYAEGILDDERSEVNEQLEANDDVSAHAEIYAASVTAKTDAYSTGAYLEVFNGDEVGQFITLRDYDTKEPLQLPSSGVLVDKKLSELLELKVGDSLTIDSDGMYQAKVMGIYENYVAHFIYLTPEAYEEIFGGAPELNGAMLTLKDRSREACEAVSTELLKLNGVSTITRAADTKDVYLNSMERVDFVVVVVILCAAALAIVVLYNLSNINMTERMRELATIKVLGFYDGEVSAYVYRENILLTAAGIALGCLMGKYLHGWLIRSVEIDIMMFGRQVKPMCYVVSGGLTALFSVIVNIIAHRQMKAIPMVESLKSAE